MFPSVLAVDGVALAGAILGPLAAIAVGVLGYLGNRSNRAQTRKIERQIGEPEDGSGDTPSIAAQIATLVTEMGVARREVDEAKAKLASCSAELVETQHRLERELGETQDELKETRAKLTEVENQLIALLKKEPDDA